MLHETESTWYSIYWSSLWISKHSQAPFCVPTTATYFNACLHLFDFVWSTYETEKRLTMKSEPTKHYTLSLYISKLYFDAARWSRWCFGHPCLKQYVVSGINYVNFVNLVASYEMGCNIGIVFINFNKYIFPLHFLVQLGFPERVIHKWAKWSSVT